MPNDATDLRFFVGLTRAGSLAEGTTRRERRHVAVLTEANFVDPTRGLALALEQDRQPPSLLDQRDPVLVLEALDVVPRESRLEVEARRALPPGLDEAPGEVTLAAAVVRGVDGDREDRVAAVDRALHRVVHPRVVAAHVELEDAVVVGRGRRRLQPGLADRREHVRHAELCRRLADGGAAARVEALEAADGRLAENEVFRSTGAANDRRDGGGVDDVVGSGRDELP